MAGIPAWFFQNGWVVEEVVPVYVDNRLIEHPWLADVSTTAGSSGPQSVASSGAAGGSSAGGSAVGAGGAGGSGPAATVGAGAVVVLAGAAGGLAGGFACEKIAEALGAPKVVVVVSGFAGAAGFGAGAGALAGACLGPIGAGLGAAIGLVTGVIAHGVRLLICYLMREDTVVCKSVYFLGTDMHIHEIYIAEWTEWRWQHIDLTEATGAPAAAADPFPIWKNGVKSVFFPSVDGHVYEMYHRDGQWHSHAPCGTDQPLVRSPIVVGSCRGDGKAVFYTGEDQHVHQLYCGPGNDWRWSHHDLTNYSSAPLAMRGGAPIPILHGEAESVAFVDSSRYIVELYNVGQEWRCNRFPPHPQAICPPTIQPVGNTRSMIYIGVDQQIHELHLNGSGEWSVYTSLAHNVRSHPSMPAFVVSDDGSKSVFYIGIDRQIHEKHISKHTNWSWIDVVPAGSHPEAGGCVPQVTVYKGNKSVYYVGVDKKIHELYINESTGWKWRHLALSAGRPDAASNPAICATGPSKSVFYRGEDMNLHEMYQPGSYPYEWQYFCHAHAPMQGDARPLVEWGESGGCTIV